MAQKNNDDVGLNLDQLVYTKKSELYYEIWKLKNLVTTISGSTGNLGGLETKSGYVPGVFFSGSPQTYQVTFANPFTSNYSIAISSEEVRVWSFESKNLNGFILNSNSNQPLTGNIYWEAIIIGEF